MTQILVTLDKDETAQRIRRAIEMLRGVLSTMVFQTSDDADSKTIKQQTYVKESLERAFSQVQKANQSGQSLQSADDFIRELQDFKCL